ncbi:MAG: polysaccharide deacetylase family protein [Bacteroidetes bacterium]|nr:polysaccharide deacetylase family protein [Bacteroidota bacterium]
MILIFSHTSSPRLHYSGSLLFKELLGMSCSFTIDAAAFQQHDGIRINYSTQHFDCPAFTIAPHALLFEQDIHKQTVDCFTYNGNTAFFKVDPCDYGFDIFAAAFYLVTRYEEYLPHTKDMYGRYAHENAIAFIHNFLQLPLVNIWAKDFLAALKIKFPADQYSYKAQYTKFRFKPTYDIDIAFSFKHKGFFRYWGGFWKDLSKSSTAFFKANSSTGSIMKRLLVGLGIEEDPFDSYRWMNNKHSVYQLQPQYFFLVAEKNGVYDKNILPHKEVMWRLVKYHAKKYPIGIHPSWQSGDDTHLLQSEKAYLEEMAGKSITTSRQHYIRFNLPEGYRRLIDAGITDDYSMGYGSINGFRASIASSFYWYDISEEQITDLRIHPFCYMEANSFYEQHFTAARALDEMKHYYQQCKAVNGTLITIWHNHFLGTDPMFAGWAVCYEEFLRWMAEQ